MAVSVDWGTKVITIPKADTQLVQSSPIEIRSLDIDAFRLELKSLEASEGIPFLDTHAHNTTVTVGGVTLARVVEIINGYTITFENGSYAVNLVGANSNISDVLNLNNVQIRSANSAGLTYSKEIENQSFLDGRIFIDTDNGLSGTQFPRGTIADPVDTYTDAKIIRELRGLSQRFLLSGALIFDVADSLENHNWKGVNSILSDITLSGGNTLNTVFDNVVLSGTYNGHCHIENSVVNGATDFQGDIGYSGIKGTLTWPTNPVNKSYVIHDSYSLIAGVGSPILDFNSATALDISIRNYSGAIELRNLVDGDVSIDLDSGSLTIDASCTGGTIVITGTGSIVDNSNGTTVVTSSLLSGSDIAATVWDSDLSSHNLIGSTGERLNDLDATYIKNAVWNSALADHDQEGTFGHELATKADIQASVATDLTTITTASIIEGDLNSGSSSNIDSRDNSYWIIDENATNRLNIEFTFNIPNTNKAGSFDLFGRYDGGASPSHYIEIWAWNVESVSWELLHEVFMDDSSSDDEYIHQYFERHIDRDLSNEVKIRLIHNSTTYSASHALYIDSVMLSSIDVETNALTPTDIINIADAVWDETLSAHQIAGTFGDQMSNLDVNVSSRLDEGVALTRHNALIAEHNSTQSDIAALNDLSVVDVQTALTAQGLTTVRAGKMDSLDNLDVAVSTRESGADASTREATLIAEHDSTQVLISALNDLSVGDVQNALTNQGYTSVRAPKLDNLDATVSSRESEADASTRASTGQGEHDATQALITGLNDLSQAEVQAAMNSQGYSAGRATKLDNLDNLDATITSRESEASALSRATTNQTEHDSTQGLIAGLNDLAQADVQLAMTAQGYTSARGTKLDNLDATVSSRESDADATTRYNDLLGENNTTQTLINGLNDPSAADIADAVWEEQLGDHSGTVGSTAETLDNVGTPASASAIADAVWNETASEHVGVGTTGEKINRLDVSVSTRESESSATGRHSTLVGEHDATQTTLATLNDISISDVQTALDNQGLTSSRSANLDNLDASVSSRESELSANSRASTNQSEHDNTQSLVSGLNVPNVNQIADAVWDEQTSGHTIAGSTGEALTDSSQDASSFADAVWNKDLSGQSAGNRLVDTDDNVEANTPSAIASAVWADPDASDTVDNYECNMTTTFVTANGEQELLVWLNKNGQTQSGTTNARVEVRDGSGSVIWSDNQLTPNAHGVFRIIKPNITTLITAEDKNYSIQITIEYLSSDYKTVQPFYTVG